MGISNYINKFATFIALLGVVASILSLFNRVPNILKWMDNWGNTTSWVIKIALVAGGSLLWFTTRPRGTNDPE